MEQTPFQGMTQSSIGSIKSGLLRICEEYVGRTGKYGRSTATKKKAVNQWRTQMQVGLQVQGQLIKSPKKSWNTLNMPIKGLTNHE